jgi:hypothetical protein
VLGVNCRQPIVLWNLCAAVAVIWGAGVLGCWGAGTSVYRSKRCAAGVGVYFRRKLLIPRDLDFANAARPFVPSHQVPSHQVLKKRVRISQRHASTLNNNHVSANPKSRPPLLIILWLSRQRGHHLGRVRGLFKHSMVRISTSHFI